MCCHRYFTEKGTIIAPGEQRKCQTVSRMYVQSNRKQCRTRPDQTYPEQRRGATLCHKAQLRRTRPAAAPPRPLDLERNRKATFLQVCISHNRVSHNQVDTQRLPATLTQQANHTPHTQTLSVTHSLTHAAADAPMHCRTHSWSHPLTDSITPSTTAFTSIRICLVIYLEVTHTH